MQVEFSTFNNRSILTIIGSGFIFDGVCDVCDDQAAFDGRVVRGPGLARGSFSAVLARG